MRWILSQPEATISQPPLLDKIAIVTGASSGIGRAVAVELARAGAHVALGARNVPALQATAEAVKALGRETLVIPTDVTQVAQVNYLVAETLGRWGRVDILVANAGDYIRARIVDLQIADMERSLAVNFYGSLYAILAVLPHLQQQHSGHIVVVSTMDSKKGLPLDAPYVAAKFALTGFAEVLRQELHGTGISVSTILPGRVDTPMIATLRVPWVSAKISAEAVARATLRAIRLRQPEVILPPQASLLHYLNVLSPHMGDWAARFFHLEGWDSKVEL